MPKCFKGPTGTLYFIGSSDEDTDPEEEARRDDFPEWERYRSARWGQDEGFEEGDEQAADDCPGGDGQRDDQVGIEQGEDCPVGDGQRDDQEGELEHGEDLKGGLDQGDLEQGEQQEEGELDIDYLIVMLLIEIFQSQ